VIACHVAENLIKMLSFTTISFLNNASELFFFHFKSLRYSLHYYILFLHP